jgi:stearoyl-CoA desaturase (delta-9 desaturase)
VDTEQDPYSIKKGFWYAHIGWMTLWTQWQDYSNVKDLLVNKLVRHQHDHYVAWGLVAGILLPLFLGALSGHLLGAFIFSVCVRLTLVYHATFCINSVCHAFGKATYDIHATARDHWLVALITNGEGYHNFHHRFPIDYRNGVRWYQWDPSKWMIAFLSSLGLVWDLRRTNPLCIQEAKNAADRERLRLSR